MLSSIEGLGRQATDMAMRAAADYVRLNGVKVVDFEQAAQCLRVEAKLAVNEAMDEAKAAFDAGTPNLAEPLFRATMTAAGIRAAKQFTSEAA